MTTEQAKLDIYTDGSCAFCQWVRARIEPWDTHGRLRFLDYNDPAVAAATPYTLEQLDHEMHVRMPNGDWVAGFTAWAKILRVLPGLAWLGWLFSKQPMRWAGPILYCRMAQNRWRWPGSPPLCSRERCATGAAASSKAQTKSPSEAGFETHR